MFLKNKKFLILISQYRNDLINDACANIKVLYCFEIV